ncbi:hypothetical protein [Streptomyces coeruleorubidus]|uniref:hypothetical protein n=1 Tax=Streptomyces coeruleorubidus TaxID=116188 RepID=UPI0033B495C5
MHRTARTVPGTGSARSRVAVLAAVVLVLLTALGIPGPPLGATGEPVAGAVAAADRHGDTGPRADDGWGVVWADGSRVGDGRETVWVDGPRADDGCDTVWVDGPRADDGCDTVCVNGPRADDGCDTVCVNGPRADDGCDAVCAVRAATRPESHSEHPAPRGHLATGAPGTDVTPPGAARPLPAPGQHTPSSGPHTPHDRGRAPPATSGI